MHGKKLGLVDLPTDLGVVLKGGCATHGSADPVHVKVVRASDVAGLMAPKPTGSDESRVFGKAFEEEFTLATHLREKSSSLRKRNFSRMFCDNMAIRLKEEGIYSEELVTNAYRMYTALLSAGVRGSKPRTRFRRMAPGVYIAAQPDLEFFDSQHQETMYFEFKTYPIDDYGRAQATVFAWVTESPVTLVGLTVRESGYIAESLSVTAAGFVPPQIPKEVGEMQEFCLKHSSPIGRCPVEGGHGGHHRGNRDHHELSDWFENH